MNINFLIAVSDWIQNKVQPHEYVNTSIYRIKNNYGQYVMKSDI